MNVQYSASKVNLSSNKNDDLNLVVAPNVHANRLKKKKKQYNK